jgi:hypothetical protein
MSMRSCALLWLGIFTATTWLGCSSDHQDTPSPPAAGHAGQATAGQGNEGGNAASTTGGSAGSSGGGAGFGGRAGMSGSGGSGGAPANSGGTSALAGSTGLPTIPDAWKCDYSAYGDGKCDCGCGAPDIDCATSDLAHCEVCNGFGSCDLAACPGHIDPDDVTQCTPPPQGWTCTAALYGDGKSCDCGCGIQDSDCPDTEAASCDNCAAEGSCSQGHCPSSLVSDDNTRCEIPAGWTCAPETYGDGTCNCGCGVVDSDCPDAKATSCEVCDETSCWPLHCDKIEADDNAHCSGPPPAWNCSARLYHDGARCDCGCGALDPDCESSGVDACEKCDAPGSCSAHVCPGIVNPSDNAHCVQPDPPADWSCQPNAYGDGVECDCGCGVPDIDCRDDAFTTCMRCLVCGGHGDCTTTVDQNDPTQCAPPPSGWLCSPEAWRDSICDCGCGVLDSYCQNIPLAYVCGNYPVEGCSAGQKTHIDPNHNYLCSVNIPSEWTCDRSFYDDGFCDCGCGAVDLDCPPDDAAGCDQCNDEGSCSTTACPGSITPNDTAHCTN